MYGSNLNLKSPYFLDGAHPRGSRSEAPLSFEPVAHFYHEQQMPAWLVGPTIQKIQVCSFVLSKREYICIWPFTRTNTRLQTQKNWNCHADVAQYKRSIGRDYGSRVFIWFVGPWQDPTVTIMTDASVLSSNHCIGDLELFYISFAISILRCHNKFDVITQLIIVLVVNIFW